MSENVQITPGTGVTIGADSVIDGTLGSAQIQYIKIMDGTIGGTNKAAVTIHGLAVDGSAVTQPISGSVTVLQLTASNLLTSSWLSDGLGNPISSTSGSLNVDVTNTVPVSGVDNSASGTFNAPGQTLMISTVGCSTVQYATTGPTWVGTIITEVSYDNGATWYPQATVDTNPTTNLQFQTWGNSASNFFNDDPWIVDVAGTTNFRLRVLTFTSGSLSLEIISTAAVSNISNPANDRWNAGSIAALNATQLVSTSGCSSCGIQITGTFIGTITFQASMDNHSFFIVPAVNVATNEVATTTTTPGNYIVTCGGYNLVQVVMSSYTSGSAVIIFNAGTGSNIDGFPNNGIVSTSAPVYTNGQVGALSLTTAGALRVDGSAVIQPVSGTVTSNIGTTGGLALDSSVQTIITDLSQFTFASTRLLVDGSGVTQPISGSVSVLNFPATQNVNVTNATLAVTQSGSWTVSLTSESIEIGKVDQGAPNTLANAWPVELSDGTNLLGTSTHPVRVDPTGTTTQPVSLASTTITGTVAVTQSTSPWVISGTVTTTPPANASTNITQWDSIALGAPSAYGTSPGAINVIGVNAFITNSPTVTAIQPTGTNLHTVVDSGSITVANASIAVTQSGAWTTGRTWDLASGTDSVTVLQPTGTNLHTVVDSGSITVANATLAVTQSTSPWVVSLTSTTITGTVAVTQSGVWTTGRTWDLSSGTDSVSAVQSGTWNIGTLTSITNPVAVTQSGIWTTGRTWDLASGTDSISAVQSGNWSVRLEDGSGTALTSTLFGSKQSLDTNVAGLTTPTDQNASGSLTVLNSAVTMLVHGMGSCAFVLSGTWVGTVVAEGSPDNGTTFVNIPILPLGGAGAVTNSGVTANGSYKITVVAGHTQIRVRMSAYTSGTATVFMNASQIVTPYNIYQLNPSNLFVTSWTNDGSGNPISSVSGALDQNLTLVGGVSVAATAKGTQATNFVGVQEAKDSGRQYIALTADGIAGVVAETLVTFTLTKQGTTTASQTNYTPTSGKTFRMQSITLYVESGAGAGGWTRIKIRHNTAGATTTSSALVFTGGTGTLNANAVSNGISFAVPDGLEIFGDGTQTIGITHTSSATTNVESITVVGYEY